MRSVAARPSGEHGLRKQRLPPARSQTLTVQVLRMQAPDPHPATVRATTKTDDHWAPAACMPNAGSPVLREALPCTVLAYSSQRRPASPALGLAAVAPVATQPAVAAAFHSGSAQGCSAGRDRCPETGLQGRVSLEDIASGRAVEGYRCNTELVGQSELSTTPLGTFGGFKVQRYVDAAGHECAYYDAATARRHRHSGRQQGAQRRRRGPGHVRSGQACPHRDAPHAGDVDAA